MESSRRSVAKAISFRILATILTLILVVYFTGNWAIAGAIGAFDFISKLVLYYVHERSWEMISWGRK